MKTLKKKGGWGGLGGVENKTYVVDCIIVGKWELGFHFSLNLPGLQEKKKSS